MSNTNANIFDRVFIDFLESLEITKNDTLQVVNPYQQKEMYEIAVAGYQNLAIDCLFVALWPAHISIAAKIWEGITYGKQRFKIRHGRKTSHHGHCHSMAEGRG